MTSAGHICRECPDEVRITRGCTRPLREQSETRPADRSSTCEVDDVPHWFWDMADTGASISTGGISPADIDAHVWDLALRCNASMDEGRADRRWREERRRKIIADAHARGRGASA